MKHTPLPWNAGAGKVRNEIAWIIWEDKPGRPYIPFTSENKSFIVRACNSHYELVEALEAMLGDNMPPAGEPGHIDYGQACKMARSALAKAKGEE